MSPFGSAILQRTSLRMLFALVLLLLLSGCNKAVSPSKSPIRSNAELSFKAVGKFNYFYQPGVILPLRDGTLLAVSGSLPTRDYGVEPIHHAADGKSYGYSHGMVEQFDPRTGKTQVLTRLPFFFHSDSLDRRQAQAIELKDGRVFIVGQFMEFRPEKEIEQRTAKPQALPRTSKTNGFPLISTAPPTAPLLFGVIFDRQRNICEPVFTTTAMPPRYFSNLQLLHDGAVLITGGAISSGKYHSAEHFPEPSVLKFDPKLKTLSTCGTLLHSRCGHACVPLDNFRFALYGGLGPSDKERRDPSTHGSLCTREVEVFDVRTGKSELVGRTIRDRYDFDVLVLDKTHVALVGGAIPRSEGLGQGPRVSEIYDLERNTCEIVGFPVGGDFATPGEDLDTRATVVGKKALLVGESNAYLYDFLSEEPLKDVPKAPVKYADAHLNVVKSQDDRVFVISGNSWSSVWSSAITEYCGIDTNNTRSP